MRICVIDFETAWSSKDYTLSRIGPVEYIRDPRFHALMMGVCIDQNPVMVFDHPDIPAVLKSLELHRQDRMVVGHNLNGFDALILSEIYNVHPYWMLDTQVMMRWSGLSRIIAESHSALTKFLNSGEKWEGTILSDGKYRQEDFTPDEWRRFREYCGDDVSQCRDNFFKMIHYMTPDAVKFATLTAKMATEPVFMLDGPLLDQYLQELTMETAKAMVDLSNLFRFNSPADFLKAIRSPSVFPAMLRQLGVEPPVKFSASKTATAKAKLEAECAATSDNVRKHAIVTLLSDPENYTQYTPAMSKTDLDFLDLQEHPDPRVALLVSTRLEQNSSILRSRAERFKALSLSGKPMPIMLSAFRAHTSRYTAGNEGTSDGLNMQNLNKRDANKQTLRRAIKVPTGMKLVAADSSQIEARMLAYVAGQEDLLKIFKNKGDPYSELAEKIFNIPWQEIRGGAKRHDPLMEKYRFVGKTGILSCLADNTLVLTNTGWVRIDCITKQHKLWDGEQWVQHQGLIYNGKRATIEMDGVSMTPDHLIFDGISWNRADRCMQTRSLWNRARQYGVDLYATFVSSGTELTSFSNARGVENRVGCLPTGFRLLQKNVFTVLNAVQKTLNTLKENMPTLPQEQNMVNLLSYAPSLMGGIGMFMSSVPAGRNPIRFLSATSCQEKAPDATNVLKQKQKKPTQKNMPSMPTYVRTKVTEEDCSTESLPVSRDAQIQKRAPMQTTAEEESLVWKIGENFFHTFLRLKGGITRLWNSTVSIIIGGMKKITYGSSTERQTSGIEEDSLNLKNVYDILNVGSKNQFLVKTAGGYLMVHNCGYQVGKKKFSDTLLRGGAKLHEDLEKHHELAFHAHAIYRLSNPKIVEFWGRAQQILELMYQGGTGTFGGPSDNIFYYGSGSILDRGAKVPFVEMPSGYRLWYPNLHPEANEHGKVQFYYDRQRGRNAVKTKIYGGAFTENLIQSLSFQLLQWQACRMLDDASIRACGNNHDCWYTVVPEAEADKTLKLMTYHMSQVPAWLPGFPVSCEGGIASDFTIA